MRSEAEDRPMNSTHKLMFLCVLLGSITLSAAAENEATTPGPVAPVTAEGGMNQALPNKNWQNLDAQVPAERVTKPQTHAMKARSKTKLHRKHTKQSKKSRGGKKKHKKSVKKHTEN